MPLWIKEPGIDDVTGTVVMITDRTDGEKVKSQENELKTTGQGVVLHPQPHNNPNDPLNWPMWRRDFALLVIGFYSFIIGGQTPLLAPVMSQFTKELHKPLNILTYLVGGFMLSMGVGSLLFAPTAVLYGKRLVYLCTQLIFLAGCIWGANAKSFGSLMGARVLTGIGGGPAESLPSATIAEIYFSHERAYRTGIYTLLLLGGKNLVPLVSGFVAHSLGWHWIYWILACIAGGAWVATFLFVHETWWDRTPVPNKRSQRESEAARQARILQHRPEFSETRPERMFSSNHVYRVADFAPVGSAADTASPDESTVKHQDDRKLRFSVESATTHAPENSANAHTEPVCAHVGDISGVTLGAIDSSKVLRTPFMKNLAVYTGRKSPDQWWMVFFRPFILYTYIPVLFSTLLYGTSVVWLSVIAETISSIFTHPPYNFPTTSVGLLYVATFLGGCLGSVIAGKSSDIIVRFMSRRNNGIYEPEFRLVMVLPVMIAVTIGLMGFGWSTFERDHWILPAIFLVFLGFGTSLGSTVAITYAVDSYRHLAAESLVALNFAKNLMGFCFGIFVPIFLEHSGLRTSYVVYGSIEIVLCLSAIPLYRYGKITRAYRDNHNIIKVLYA